MANNKNFIAKNGVSTGDGYSMPDIRPSLLLDFANSKTLDPRITFTRGSTGTYWDGKTTAKAEENLVKYSQDYSQSDWSKFNLTVTDDATTAPDGTTTAASLITTTANDNHYIAFAYTDLSNKEVTQSWFAKANGYNHCFVGHGIGPTEGAWFNLSTGATGTVGSAVTSSSITSVGNGWYRCSITYTINQSVRYAIIAATNADGTVFFTGDGSSGIYAWGAQVEQRDAVTAYTATTSRPIVKYQPTLQTAASGEARFDHDPVTGESKGLLIEEARTNLATYSEAFNSWTKLYSTVESNAAIAPDGTLTADKLVPDTTNTTAHRVSIPQGFTLGTSYAFSVYAKAGEKQYLDVRWYDGNTNAARVVFDVSNGTISNTHAGTGVVEDVGNGWYRCSVYASATNTTISGFALIYVEDAGAGAVTYQGNGYDGLYLWGAQFEVGTFPTSYIPTSGSTVTRSPDDAAFSSSQIDTWFPQLAGDTNNGGSFYFEWNSLGIVGSNDWSCLFRNANTGERMGMYEQSDGVVKVEGEISSSAQFSINTGTAVSGINKLAASIKEDDFAASLNGGAAVTDTSGRVPSGINTFYFGWYTTDNSLQSHIKKFAFYPQRLSNATLQAMTEE